LLLVVLAEPWADERVNIHLDFETRSAVDLPKEGLVRHTRDPSFQVLLTGFAWGDAPTMVGEGPPPSKTLAEPQVVLHAFNAPFERAVLRACGYDLPASRFSCTMAKAYSMGFSGGLAAVGAQVGLNAADLKAQSGTWLIKQFCTPRADGTFTQPSEAPADWALFKQYCGQDVTAERAIDRWLDQYNPGGWSPMEQAAWNLDQAVNDRGLPVDLELVENAQRLTDRFRLEDEARMARLTGGLSSGQTGKLLEWARDWGYTGNTLQAGEIREWLKDPFNPTEAAEVLQLRLDLSQSATAKFTKIRMIQWGGRVFNTLQFHGAGRTGRWAGRGLQLQNLKRPKVKHPEKAADLLCKAPEAFAALYTLEDLGSLIRSAVKASDGKRLVVADLASIESRVLGWLAGCRALNAVFRDGRDPYKDFGSKWLNKAEADLTKAERNVCKPPALGCGYGLGPVGLVKYADSMGVPMTEHQAQSAVNAFRGGYPEIPGLWRRLGAAFNYATVIGEPSMVGPVTFERNGPFVTVRLPSGRRLWYHEPQVEEGQASYMGQDQYTGQWTRINTWGGKLTENLVQAIARDVLLEGLLAAERAGLTIVGHVHDEIICEEDVGNADDALRGLVDCMVRPIEWAPGLLLGAEGYVAERYRKG
jgi:DNA polymerase